MVSDEAATSGAAPRTGGAVATAAAGAVVGAVAGLVVAAVAPPAPLAGVEGRAGVADVVTTGATDEGSFVFSANVKSKGRSLPSGSNFTFSLTFSGSVAPLRGVSSALVIRPGFSGNESSSFSFASSNTTLPEKPLTGIGRV